jgi:hypothetical protein
MTHSWDSDGPLFSHVIHYADLDSAYALCMYRAIYICATEWQHVLDGGDRARIRDLPQVQRMALDICRSVDYYLLPKNIRSGSWHIIFPDRVAYYACPKPHANFAGSQAFSRILQLTPQLKLAGRYCTIFLCLQEAVSQILERAILRTNETGHCTNDLSQNLASTARPLHSC